MRCGLNFYDTERVVTLPQYGIVGTVDALFRKPDGSFVMVDLLFYIIWNKWHRKKGKSLFDDYKKITREQLSKSPWQNEKNRQQCPIIALVDKILAAKKANPQVDTSAWERAIDGLVYELYGLTEEEVKVVEGGVWKQPSKTYLLSLYVVPVLQKDNFTPFL